MRSPPLSEQFSEAAPWAARLDPIAVLARISLIGFIVWGAWYITSQPLVILIPGAFLLLRMTRNRFQFGALHGSARWASAPQLQADDFFGEEGLLLCRYREHTTSLAAATVQLVTGSLKDSDAICRGFLTTLTGRRVNLLRSDGPLIRVPPRKYVNLITVAPAGAGKGVGTVIPNLLHYPHSVIVTDIKGENFELTVERRKSLGQQIVALDPFGITGKPSATLNPLDLIRNDSPTLMEDVRALAEAMVIRTGKDTDPHWNESASSLLYAVILLVSVECQGEERTLDKVRMTLTDQTELMAALEFMKESTKLNGMLSRAAGSLLSMPEKEFGSVLSTVNRHTNFLDSPSIRANTETTSFDIRRVAARPTTVYLILPAQYLQSHARLMMLWITSFLLVVKQAGASETHELLFMLDEVAQLGEVPGLEQAITLLRGFGLRLWFIVQSLAQLEVAFPGPRSKVILANCGIQQFFGVADIDTATYISKYIGTETRTAPNYQSGSNTGSSTGQQSSSWSSGRSHGTSHGATQRELIKPEEVLRERDGVFILQQGRDPILGSRLTYYSDPDLETGYDSYIRPASKICYVIASLGVLFALNLANEYMSPRLWLARQFAGAASPAQVSPVGEAVESAVEPPRLPSGKQPRLPQSIPVVVRPPKPREPIIAECPKCKASGPLPADYNGEEVSCPNCETLFIVPINL